VVSLSLRPMLAASPRRSNMDAVGGYSCVPRRSTRRSSCWLTNVCVAVWASALALMCWIGIRSIVIFVIWAHICARSRPRLEGDCVERNEVLVIENQHARSKVLMQV
jgi:hypothetical protein